MVGEEDQRLLKLTILNIEKERGRRPTQRPRTREEGDILQRKRMMSCFHIRKKRLIEGTENSGKEEVREDCEPSFYDISESDHYVSLDDYISPSISPFNIQWPQTAFIHHLCAYNQDF